MIQLSPDLPRRVSRGNTVTRGVFTGKWLARVICSLDSIIQGVLPKAVIIDGQPGSRQSGGG